MQKCKRVSLLMDRMFCRTGWIKGPWSRRSAVETSAAAQARLEVTPGRFWFAHDGGGDDVGGQHNERNCLGGGRFWLVYRNTTGVGTFALVSPPLMTALLLFMKDTSNT